MTEIVEITTELGTVIYKQTVNVAADVDPIGMFDAIVASKHDSVSMHTTVEGVETGRVKLSVNGDILTVVEASGIPSGTVGDTINMAEVREQFKAVYDAVESAL